MSKHKDKDKNRSRSRSKSKDRERREKKKSKKSKRSRSRERKHRRSRSRSYSRSPSGERRRHRREERYEREREREAREMREKELEKERLREIALEFKQSGAFSSISQQTQSFQLQDHALNNVLSSFPTFNSFPMAIVPPVIETPQPPPREMSQAYLEAVEASKRIAASKNFVDAFSCSNSNDSTSNGASLNNEGSSNSMNFVLGGEAETARQRKKRSRWGGSENDKTFIPGMPTVLPSSLDSHQQEAYLVQLQIEEISRKLRTGDLGIASVEERSPSPEPIYSSDGKRMNTREFRTRKRLEEQRHQLILRMQCMNPDFKPPSDYKAPIVRVSDKVLIPQEEHPDINFVGLLIGPRGNTLKAMEKETGAKIIIRGKGSVKEGKVGRKDGQPLPGEDEPLHAFITAANADCVKKAVEKINEVIKQGIEVPEGHNDLRRMQLRELAQLNGTLRETDVPRCTNCGSNEHKSWHCTDKPNVTNNIMCSSCGGAGHISKDCKAKRPGQGGPPVVNANSQAKIDEEYLSLMAELGEGPPATKTNDTPSQSSGSSNRNQFSIFERNQGPLKAIQQAPSSAPASNSASPVQQPPPRMPQPPNWNGQPAMPVPPLPPGGSFAMPPPSMRPPMWNNQPQIPGTDLPPVPSSTSCPPPFVPPPPPGTSNWSAPLPPPAQQYPWSNGNFVPPLPAVPPPPPPPPGS